MIERGREYWDSSCVAARKLALRGSGCNAQLPPSNRCTYVRMHHGHLLNRIAVAWPVRPLVRPLGFRLCGPAPLEQARWTGFVTGKLSRSFIKRKMPSCQVHEPDWSVLRLFVTENTPGTELACTPAAFLSASLATAPSRVTRPLLTMMWIGGTARKAY